MSEHRKKSLWGSGTTGKQLGLAQVERMQRPFVELMRERAIAIARATGRVTSDDLRAYAQAEGIVPEHSNCWGAIFRGSCWRCVGRVKSKLTSNHSREIRVWELAQ